MKNTEYFNEITPKEKAEQLIEAIELLTESRPTHFDKIGISKYFVGIFINDLKESLEISQEIKNKQAEGLIAGSILIWTEIKKQLPNLKK